jgi:Amt family ammonium transporter
VPKGWFWGGGSLGFKQFFNQVWGNIFMAAAAFAIAFALMHAVKLTRTLRISEEGELEGIDIHEHGSPAYHPESAFMGKGL